MFKSAAAEGLWSSDKLGLLFETAQVRIRAGDGACFGVDGDPPPSASTADATQSSSRRAGRCSEGTHWCVSAAKKKRPHLHVLPRENSNGARVKNGRRCVVPVSHGFVHLYEQYRNDRDKCRQADDSDFVFVNLFRARSANQ
jgi:hypothetical protein